MKLKRYLFLLFVFVSYFHLSAEAAVIRVNMYSIPTPDNKNNSSSIGSVVMMDTTYGLLIIPDLSQLSPGLHGFHLHVNPSCAEEGQQAGGHLDPKQTNNHLGPYSKKGHLGDLPALFVDDKGIADLPVLAPRLKVNNLKGHALIIHAGGDNYADIPEKMGGGGARIACGVIETLK